MARGKNMTNMELEYKGYHTIIRWSEDDKQLYGKIENIDDFVNFEIHDIRSAEAEFRSAVEYYLAFCREFGKRPERGIH